MQHAIRRVVYFGAAGIVINLLVAALLALFVNVHVQRGRSSAGQFNDLSWSFYTTNAFGSQRVQSEIERQQITSTALSPDSLVPSWLPGHLVTDHASNLQFAKGHFEARGWPLLSFWCENERNIVLQDTTSSIAAPAGGFALPFARWPTYFAGTLPRLIPLRPIWIGIFLNTLFYAGLAAAFFWLARNQLRAHRFAKGLCPRCRYNMRHVYSEPCPECGWFHSPPRVA